MLLSMAASSQAQFRLKPERKWTILIYWAVDNDLYDFSLPYFEALRQIPASKDVTLLVETDYPGSRPTERILIEGQKQTVLQVVKERNSADPDALQDFIQFGKTYAPAQHTVLVIGSHGSNWSGVISDDSSKGYMKLSELRAALKDQALDLVIFDACRMAYFETLLSLEGRVKTFAASPFDVDGFNHVKPLTALTLNPKLSTRELATLYAKHYPTKLIEETHAVVSASVISTVGATQMRSELEHFFAAINEHSLSDIARFKHALRSSVSSDGDLSLDLLQLIAQAGIVFPDLTSYAQRLLKKYTQGALAKVLTRTPLPGGSVHSGLGITCARDSVEYEHSLAGELLPQWVRLCKQLNPQ